MGMYAGANKRRLKGCIHPLMAEPRGPHRPRPPTFLPKYRKPCNEKNVAEFWQYFVDSISNIFFVIWQDFVVVWQNTPCTVCHPAMDCLPHWCCWTVLPEGVIQHKFSQKWCHFTCLCTWASEGIFPGGGTSGFFQTFFYGRPKVVKFDSYHSKLRKQHFLLKFSNSCPPSDTHACV